MPIIDMVSGPQEVDPAHVTASYAAIPNAHARALLEKENGLRQFVCE